MIKNSLALLAVLLAGTMVAQPAQAAGFTMKRGINLDAWVAWPDESRWNDRSVILPFPEWRQSLEAADLEALKAAGFDFVRMPVDPAPLLSEKSSGLRERLFQSVLDSARMINAAGLKAVVDLHLMPTGSNRSVGMSEVMDDPATFERYVETVRTMAQTLSREDPALVALELMNEPVTGCEGAEAKAWAERLKRLFAAARASATRMTLVLSGACWGTAEGLAAVDPVDIPDDNLIWSFHSYAPFLLTHQGATWAGDFIPYVTGIPYPPSSVSPAEMETILDTIRARIEAEAPWTRRSGLLSYLDELYGGLDTPEKVKAAMDEPFAVAAAWAQKHGVPSESILLGEFGMIRQEWQSPHVVAPASRAAYYRDMIGLAEKHGFAWSMWSYGGAFGVVQEFEGRRAEPDVLEMVRGLPR